jgi:integrase
LRRERSDNFLEARVAAVRPQKLDPTDRIPPNRPVPRGHEATKKGRSQARETSEISFHSLRHSAVTMLKAAGVSDFIAREIVGHESAAVSRQYTHLTTDDKRAAMRRLPDVTDT